MTIVELKKNIESNNLSVDKIQYIFKYADNDFLCSQYASRIADMLHLKIEYIDKLDVFRSTEAELFGDQVLTDNLLYILHIEVLDTVDIEAIQNVPIIIICKKTSAYVNQNAASYIIEFPKLENWQIQDYAYSIVKGIDHNKVNWLLDNCHYDIFRVNNELDKLKLFNEAERSSVFSEFVADDIFSDLTNYSIFNFTNALVTKNMKQLLAIYEQIANIDINDMGLLTVLYNNFKNILCIQLSVTATAESLGMSSKQFYAIKNNCIGYYRKESLVNIFLLLTDIDKQIKTGQLPIDVLRDYLVVKILSM